MQIYQEEKIYPAWHEVEGQIQKEINWLRGVIELFNKRDRGAPSGCDECFMRKIAVLIVVGKVKATEIKKEFIEDFWNDTALFSKQKIYHGSDWHRETMEKIERHFIADGYQVKREPALYWGRADLGVYKEVVQDLLIEVGTTSFYKLWMNLEVMRDFTYLLVPDDRILIEFVRQ